MVSTATLSLTPLAAEALSLVEEGEIARRCVDLHCRMDVVYGHGWTIRVSSWATDEHHTPLHRVEWFRQKGHLADRMQAALNAYEKTATVAA